MSSTKDFQFNIDLGNGITVAEAAIAIYAVTGVDPKLLENPVVDESDFSLALPVDGTGSFYVVAEVRAFRLDGKIVEAGDRRLQLLSVFTEADDTVALSERLTVATAYSFARFLKVEAGGNVVISDPNQALQIAYGMKNNFVATDGTLSDVIRSSPNGMETNSYAMLNSLSNLVYYSLTSAAVYADFTRLTRAGSLLESLLNLALEPFTKVRAIYALTSQREQVYAPSLPSLEPPASPIPEQWTLTIKVNDSGAENFMIAGVGNVAFDKNDRVWLTNNFRQGTPNSSTFCVILEPDGSPAPFSPLFGGGLLGAGFGVTSDPTGETIYIGNYGWGPAEQNPHPGSVSAFSSEGEVLSPCLRQQRR